MTITDKPNTTGGQGGRASEEHGAGVVRMMSELDVLNDNHTSISFSTPSVSGISKIHKGVPKDWAKGTTKDLIDHMLTLIHK